MWVCAYKMERTFLCTAIKIQQQQTTARAANEPRIIAVSVRKEKHAHHASAILADD